MNSIRAFQNEIDFCQKEIRKSEDRILELMGESEPLDKNVKAAEAALESREGAGGGGKAAGTRAHAGR